MTFISVRDWETGDVSQQYTADPTDGLADGLAYPGIVAGRAILLDGYGRSYSNAVGHQLWQSRWKMNETTGFRASDSIGGRSAVINGGVTLNQVGLISENPKCFLFNGTSGYLDLSSTTIGALNLTTGDWAISLIFQAVDLSTTRGLIGGPTGAVTVAIAPAPGHPNEGSWEIGVSGKGALALADTGGGNALPRVQVGQWWFANISYDSAANAFTINAQAWGGWDAFSGGTKGISNRTPFSFAGWSGIVTPTAGTKSNLIGLKSAGTGFFAGTMQELLYKPAKSSQAEYSTLREDAAHRSVDGPHIVQPDAGPTKVAMQRIVMNPPIAPAGQPQDDRAEWITHFDYGQYHLQRFFYGFSINLDPDSNWTNTPVSWCGDPTLGGGGTLLGLGQLLYRDIQSCSMSFEIAPAGWQGTTALSLVMVGFGGFIQAGVTPPTDGSAHFLMMDANAASPWSTLLDPAQACHRQPQRWPQAAGPNTMLAGNRPFTPGHWHDFVYECLHATNTPVGQHRVYHRCLDLGLPWAKTMETPATYKTVQYNSMVAGQGHPYNSKGSNEFHSQGSYVYRLQRQMAMFQDQFTISTSLAEAQSKFAPSGGVITGSGPAAISGGGFVSVNSGGQPAAADQWGQAVLQLPNLAAWWRLDDGNTTLVDILASAGNGTYTGGYTQSVPGIPGAN